MTPSPLRVLHVVDSLAGGGAAALEVTFAEVARHRPVDLTVAALYPSDVGVPDHAPELRALGVRVHAFEVAPGGLSRRVLPASRLAGLVRTLRPHVLRTALSAGNTFGTAVGILTRTPVVATLHATVDETERHSARMRVLETVALRHGVTTVVAVGESVAASHRERLRREVVVVPNAVPHRRRPTTGERTALRRELCGDPDRPLLLTVGRLVPQKGLPDLLLALALLLETVPDAVLALAGPGPLHDALEQRVRDGGLAGSVRLLGNRTDVDALLGSADVFVSASLWEGLPLAVLEAMAAGLPVVATAVGENPLLLGSGRGHVVPPSDPAALAARLRAVLRDPAGAARGAAAAQAYVTQVHGPEAWVDRMLSVYEDAAGRRPADAGAVR